MTTKRWSLAFFALVVLFLLVFATVSLLCLNGRVDPYYERISSPMKSSLIIGTSRAAQGIQPAVINDSNLDFDGPIYNFSFTGLHSPYGPAYLDSIRKKIEPETTEGLYILEVNPKSVSYIHPGNEEEQIDRFREEQGFLSGLESVTAHPNLMYLRNYYNEPYANIILSQIGNQESYLHNDGWLEVSVSMNPYSITVRSQAKIDSYKKDFAFKYRISDKRLASLNELITFLNSHGNVFLVRYPTSTDMLDLEQKYLVDFSELMRQLAEQNNVVFIDMTNIQHEWQTTDGNHLWKESGETATRYLVEYLREWASEAEPWSE